MSARASARTRSRISAPRVRAVRRATASFTVSWLTAPPRQMTRAVATSCAPSLENDLVDEAAQERLALRIAGGRGVPEVRQPSGQGDDLIGQDLPDHGWRS